MAGTVREHVIQWSLREPKLLVERPADETYIVFHDQQHNLHLLPEIVSRGIARVYHTFHTTSPQKICRLILERDGCYNLIDALH